VSSPPCRLPATIDRPGLSRRRQSLAALLLGCLLLAACGEPLDEGSASGPTTTTLTPTTAVLATVATCPPGASAIAYSSHPLAHVDPLAPPNLVSDNSRADLIVTVPVDAISLRAVCADSSGDVRWAIYDVDLASAAVAAVTDRIDASGAVLTCGQNPDFHEQDMVAFLEGADRAVLFFEVINWEYYPIRCLPTLRIESDGSITYEHDPFGEAGILEAFVAERRLPVEVALAALARNWRGIEANEDGAALEDALRAPLCSPRPQVGCT
jgi:hypothetical protein